MLLRERSGGASKARAGARHGTKRVFTDDTCLEKGKDEPPNTVPRPGQLEKPEPQREAANTAQV